MLQPSVPVTAHKILRIQSFGWDDPLPFEFYYYSIFPSNNGINSQFSLCLDEIQQRDNSPTSITVADIMSTIM